MPNFPNPTRNAVVDALTSLVNGGSIKAYDSQGGTLLVEFGPILFEAAGTTAQGQAAVTGLPISGTGLDNGKVGYYEAVDSGGSTVQWSGPACHSGDAVNWQASTTYAQDFLVFEPTSGAYYRKKDAGDSGATFQRHLWRIQEVVISGVSVTNGGTVNLNSGGAAAPAVST